MSDLLERLKLAATMFNDCEVSSFAHGEFNAGELLEQAAAKIERLQGASAPDITGLSVTEAICLDKLKKERDAYREALTNLERANDALATKRSPKLYLATEAEAREELCDLDTARRDARTLLSQSSEGE